MKNCPEDGLALTSTADAVLACAVCGGACLSTQEITALTPGIVEELSQETREDSGAFARDRRCPGCGALMAPWRLGKLEAWVERCASCDLFWFERQDRRTAQMLSRQKARQDAVEQISPSERQELARDLAQAAAESAPRLPLSPFHEVLTRFGLPVVTRTESYRTPLLTFGLAAVLIAVYVAGLVDPRLSAWERAYEPKAPTLVAAFTATFFHFNWLHLLGNVWLLVAFGDGVEQKVSRPTLLALFVLGGAASLGVDGLLNHGIFPIAGASGGIAVLIGVCWVLQREAHVALRFAGASVEVRLGAFALGGVLGYGFLLLIAGMPGMGARAELVGLMMGVVVGRALRRGS